MNAKYNWRDHNKVPEDIVIKVMNMSIREQLWYIWFNEELTEKEIDERLKELRTEKYSEKYSLDQILEILYEVAEKHNGLRTV